MFIALSPTGLHSGDIEHYKSDPLPLAKVREHIVRKAGYKTKVGSQYVRIGAWARAKKLIEGNNADARYHRVKYESSQLLAGSSIAAKARNRAKGLPEKYELGNDSRLKNNFYRQDNFKFKKELLERETVSGSTRNKWAHRLCRWAHTANGLTELAAAPTGMSVKITRNLQTPHAHEKGFTSHLQMLLAVPVIGFCISKLYVGPMALYAAAGGGALASWVGTMVVSFSAVGALLALTSLTLGAASSALMDNAELSKDILKDIDHSEKRYLGRILTLLREVEGKPDAKKILNMALSEKISSKYIIDQKESTTLEKISDTMRGVKSDSTSVLVHKLLAAIEGEKNDANALIRLEHALGDYLTQADPMDKHSGLIDVETSAGKKQTVRREMHYLALTNLIEHKRTDEDHDPENYKHDLRLKGQAWSEKAREKGIFGLAYVMRKFGCPDASQKLKTYASKEWISSVQKNRDLPQNARKHRSSMDKILANPHQYGFVTRNCARIADGLRIFNYAIVMSLNYVVTRPCMPVFTMLQRALTGSHGSRSLAFSFGRFWSSAGWAAFDALLFIGPLKAIGVLPQAFGAAAFPFVIAANSTAFQMLGVGILALIPMAIMHIALKAEGWKGDIAPELEKANSKRNPMVWAN